MYKSKVFLLIALIVFFANSAIISNTTDTAVALAKAAIEAAKAIAASAAATSKCLPRKTIIARGQSWVDKKTPYSQTKTF